jgi:DNA-binding response OmpR family regulator
VAILVVEDEQIVREFVAESLLNDGLAVLEAPTAEDALGLALHADSPEAVVTDVNLGPGMDGVRLAREVRRKWPHAGIVIMTGNPSRIPSQALGPDDQLLMKPFDSPALIRAVRQVMHRSEK